MRILGVDIGSSSVKAVEIDSAFGRFDIHNYHEQEVTSDSTPGQAAEILLSQLTKTPDRVITYLKASQTTLRNLQLPTRDKKAIQAGVGFELEDELPFSTEDSAYDYAILTQNKQGSSIHVAATLKTYVSSAISNWHRFHFDPDLISTEPWAYRTLLNRVLGAEAAQDLPILLVQMGHEKTTLYLHWKGLPALIREIPWGGQGLTQAISHKYQLTLEQAESIKLDRGSIVPSSSSTDVTPEQVELSNCLEAELIRLLPELRQIEFMSKSITRHNIHSIYLAGGTSLLPGLSSWLEGKLKVSVKPLLALSSMTSSGVTYSDQTDARFLLAASLGLSIVGSDRSICINFRKGEFSKEGRSREFNLKALTKPLIAVGTVAVSLFLSLTIQYSVYQSKLKTTDALLEKSVRSFFGQISSSAVRTYLASTSKLRTDTNKELTKQRELNRLFGPSSRSPVDFLKGLSASIPRDVVVDLTQFQAGGSTTESYLAGDSTQSASLTFLVNNPQMVERLATLVGSRLNHVQRSKIDEVSAPDETGKKWKVTFTGKPTEDSYGK